MDLDKWMDMQVGGTETASGVYVNENTALNATGVLACVKIISQTVASLPLPVYERLQPRGKRRAIDHPLYSLLHDQPNPEMTSMIFRETLQGHLCTWGNAYAEIQWGANGWPVALWPLRPDKMLVKRIEGKITYIYRLPTGVDVKIPAYRILHIPGFGFDGLVGYSPIQLAKDAIGLSMAAEQYNNRFFKNDGRPGGVLQHPKELGDKAYARLKKDWAEMHTGLSNAHRFAILEEGMEFKEIGFPPESAQLLGTRKFQINEIARIYQVPPHMLADLERATFSNIEHQSIDFVVHTMRPWLVRWEQGYASKLFRGDKKHFAEHLIDGLLRGDAQTRAEFYGKMFNIGVYSQNDIREKENDNPFEGGDKHYVPLNMVPIEMIEDVLDPEPSNNSRSLPMEERKLNAAKNRSRIAKQYEKIFADSASRIVKREAADVKKAIKSHLKERDSTDFILWLEKFYREAPEWIQRTILPVLLSLGEAIQAEAIREVNAEPKDVTEWVNGYAERFAKQYANSSEGQIRSLLEKSSVEGVPPLELVEQRLTEWEERRPNKIAIAETVELSNKMARFVFAGAGITRLRWVAIGNKSCPYCQELDGKVVGIDSPFVGASQNLESEDGRMKINKPTITPQLHEGCECQIVPD